MDDQPLDKAIILDTHEDIATRISVRCDSCGTELEVTEIREEAEVAVVLEVPPCHECTQRAHHHGFIEGQDSGQGMGY